MTPDQIAGDSEHSQQAAFMCFCQQSGIQELKWIFAIPNGFFGSAAQKNKMKSEGLKSGVWDVFEPIPRSWMEDDGKIINWHGLFIEFKQEKYRNRAFGGLTDEQIEFRDDLQGDYAFAVVYNWLEAKEAVLKYLGKG